MRAIFGCWREAVLLSACLGLLLPTPLSAAQYFELTAEIETFGYRLGDTNWVAKARRQTVNVKCVTGSTGWSIEHDFHERQEWAGEGTNVVFKNDPEWPTLKEAGVSESQYLSTLSRNGLPLGEFGVNLPWLAFCSGTYLKREGRIIALPGGVLRPLPGSIRLHGRDDDVC